ncbi:sigma 54-interacting transcriptional regulator [Clostridium bowmanii]|uniref:sigma 54-interacting transcriptional regulator n=1 Tax=Clostridium bowmanii TaxID=132925 RepID=UPI001C0DB8DC|nr:sigma 54-interacting transcriptional regulator [Clostridium bowmanii]MBU3188895.1 sigma 54-interacting transcriptional regulator [Clostridium bowmanii]MCA1073699.1 sigma 54-interacting transcriptional regulator [Clostridium bowmanii]
MKKLVLIAGTSQTKVFLHSQLKEYFSDIASIKSYAIDEGIDEEIWGDLFIFSSELVLKEISFEIKKDIPIVIANRTINYSNIDKLLFLPSGCKVIFVNDVAETTYGCIDILMGLGIDHIKYIPYYPGIKSYQHCDIAVTPGEVDKVPKGIQTIVDIGSRPFDMSTLFEIMYKIDCVDGRATDISLRYVKKIIELSKNLMVKNKEMLEFEKHIENVLIQKRYFAKYTFDHIIGVSECIKNAKSIGKKLAKTDLAVLIHGESGTGKELFASAIHNASKRKNGPFIALNFSALPENLVESELFGYEEGSFTGAKKGGKMGIFEQASGGTIFLDEIGDAPLAVQARLLRVLQEKEIMRVGGNRILSLDIRIVSATNKNLLKRIEEGKFREDLYYRLKIGYIEIPPLRSRKVDILPIARNFIKNNKEKLEFGESFIEMIESQDWYGNIRELLNAVEYAIALREEDKLQALDLPLDVQKRCCFEVKQKTDLSEEMGSILLEIFRLQKEGILVGRRKLSEVISSKGNLVTEQAMRSKLNHLEKNGFITKGRGKVGTQLTEKGEQLLGKNI